MGQSNLMELKLFCKEKLTTISVYLCKSGRDMHPKASQLCFQLTWAYKVLKPP